MCDSALKQWRKWLSESCQGLQDQGYMFQQKVRCIGKKGNPHLQSATNHNPARADERLVGSPEHTHSCEGCCGHTAGSNGRWGDAIPDNLGCVGRPGRAPEPWKWRHSPLWAAVLDAGKKASVRMASAFNYYSHLWRPPWQSIGPWTPELLHFNTHTGYNSVMVGINTLTRSWETRLAMQRHLSRNGHRLWEDEDHHLLVACHAVATDRIINVSKKTNLSLGWKNSAYQDFAHFTSLENGPAGLRDWVIYL